MSGADTCVACAGLDFPCETCGLLIVWNVTGTCEYCQEEVAREIAKELAWWQGRKQRKVA